MNLKQETQKHHGPSTAGRSPSTAGPRYVIAPQASRRAPHRRAPQADRPGPNASDALRVASYKHKTENEFAVSEARSNGPRRYHLVGSGCVRNREGVSDFTPCLTSLAHWRKLLAMSDRFLAICIWGSSTLVRC